jgi:acetyl esterase/lipase
MGFGHNADLVAGRLSRILHGLRGPKENTVGDVGPYLDRPVDELCPEPPPLEHVRVHEGVASRLLRTTTLSWKSSHQILSPAYRRRHEGEYRVNQTVWARWLRPDGARRKGCLVYVHGWLEPGSWIEEAFVFPSWTAELGVDILHVALPFHGPRNPRGALFSGEYYWTADLVRSFEGVLQTIHDVRSAMGWLRRQGYERVGAAGISLGGSLAMLLACLPPTPDYVIPILSHLRLSEAVENASIMWRVKKDLERWGVDATERRRLFSRFSLEHALPVLPPERQLWVEAREDAHIDPALVTAQWEQWGRPNIHWIPGGHMTFPLHLAEITRAMRAFLEHE